MTCRRLHVLFEHDGGNEPFASSYIRLLRPLSHPALAEALDVTIGLEYEGQLVDAVIVDRLWRPDVSPELIIQLVERVHQSGARLLYAIDDNLPELVSEHKDWQPTTAQLGALEVLFRQADGLIVTTAALREQFLPLNPRIATIPNVLDERLLYNRRRSFWPHMVLRGVRWGKRKASHELQVIGYMGTLTHDDDLLLILPALQSICRRHAGQVALEIVGVMTHSATVQRLEGLPVRVISPGLEHGPYPAFLNWFSRLFWWDIALAPLCDTVFNRCKSDIKFLDYSAISAAGIYSRVPAYEATVQHSKNGLLVDNTVEAWEAALETLLSRQGLRFRLGLAALRYLLTQRTVAYSRRGWEEALAYLLS